MATATSASVKPVRAIDVFRDLCRQHQVALAWHPNFRCLTRDGLVLSGLTSKLESNFYPNYTFFNAREAATVRVEVTSSTSSRKRKTTRHRSVPIWVLKRMMQNANLPPTTPASVAPSAVACPTNKRNRTAEGRRLDREVLMTVEYWIGDMGMELRDVVRQTAPVERLQLSEAMRKKFEHDMREQSCHTQRLWRELYERGMEPVGSQVMVGAYGVGTLCDLVCWQRRTQKWVIVENKVGFDYWRYGSGASLEEPFRSQTDCPLNQHLLQTAATTWLFMQTFGFARSDMATLLVRLHGVGNCETTRVEDHAWLVEDNFKFCERLARMPKRIRASKVEAKRPSRQRGKTSKRKRSTSRKTPRKNPTHKAAPKRKRTRVKPPPKRKKQRVV